jgi:SH3-like domain-containing protein
MAAATAFGVISGAAAEELLTGTVTGLPIPRFVSLKPSDTPMRQGPGKDHHINWIFKRSGLPVEVTAEFDNWRRVRDSEGTEGWIYHSRLSGKRTAMVQSKSRKIETLYHGPSPDSAPVALLEQGVIGEVDSCDGRWCRIHGKEFDGYMPQERLWGVYVGETVDE